MIGRGVAACAGAVVLAACHGDRGAPPARPGAPPPPDGQVQVAVALPEQPGWNQDDSILVSLANGGADAVPDAALELTVPAPISVFRDTASHPRPVVDSTAAATRVTFHVGAIAAGARIDFHQRIRTPPAPVAPTPPPGAAPSAARPARRASRPDTVTSFVVRVRLLRGDGTELLPPAYDTLRIRAGSEVTIGGCGNASDAVVTRYGVGPVRVGMPVSALRAACPEARDTAWKQEGTAESGLVALPGGRRVLAVTTRGAVQRIVIDQPGLRTAGGDSVGGTVGELRASYGRMCAGTSERQVAVWFPNAPGLSFGLDTAVTRAWPPARASADSIPDDVKVAALWVRQGRDDCPR